MIQKEYCANEDGSRVRTGIREKRKNNVKSSMNCNALDM